MKMKRKRKTKTDPGKRKPIFRRKTPSFNNPILLAGSAQGIGARENQQDSCCICDRFTQGLLAVAADGMGGLKNGAEISNIVTYVFQEYFNQLTQIEYPEYELLQMLMEACRHVDRYMEKENVQQGGSTVAVVYIRQDKLYYLSVGDSHIYLLRNGGLIQLNRDHIYAYELDERVVQNRISFEEALTHRERRALTSYVGMSSIAAVDRNLMPLQLRRGDRVLLATDGVFGTLSDEELCDVLQRADDPGTAAAILESKVREKNKPGQDNSTSVVIIYE